MPAGLEDVVAGQSGICFIDGEKGILSYRGYNIHELAPNSTFEETAHLLWYGSLPTPAELEDTSRAMAAGRAIAGELIAMMRHFPKSAAPMAGLRTAISGLALFDPEAEDLSPAANQRKALRLTAQISTVVAALARLRRGETPVPPRTDLGHAANFYYMLFERAPNSTVERLLDVALILHADHEFNASTFAARVTAATLSDMHSSVTSAVGALKGSLHGGANANVMRMLLDIGEVSRVEPVIRKMLDQKRKIPGFGHRVYKTEDPRATHLRQMSREAGIREGEPKWFDMSVEIEKILKAEKNLNANVDFYSASAYHVIGLPIDLFTPFFAISRMAGWTAHLLEQYTDNRLIRPRAEYTGPDAAKKWVPIDQRK
jgi:citrate synthase